MNDIKIEALSKSLPFQGRFRGVKKSFLFWARLEGAAFKQTFILSIILLCVNAVYPQSIKTKYYFVTKSNDTTFCKNLDFGTNIQGSLNALIYEDMNGKKVNLEGRKNVPDVVTFYINDTITDKVPLKPNKPDGFVRYIGRSVNGKLKVYSQQQGYMNYAPGESIGVPNSAGGPSGKYIFYIKMPEGTFYKINKKSNMKKYIIPYVSKCEEFKSKYKGDYSTLEKPFIAMIRLYNSLCK